MRTFTRGAILALVVAITFTAPSKSWGQGKGGGGSGGGTAQAAGALYGDLYVIERNGNGEPVLRTQIISGVTYTCQQPLAAGCAMLPLNYDKGDFNPELEDACAVQDASAILLQEVKFGRESVSRAPATVIDKSYGEALKAINLATPNACGDSRAIKLDPAGRITLCLPLETVPVTYAWKTIDAPLENLGLYRAAMTTGCFGPVTDEKVGEEGVRIIVTIQLSDAAKTNLGDIQSRPPGVRRHPTQPCDEGRHALGGRVPRGGGGQVQPGDPRRDHQPQQLPRGQQVDLHHGEEGEDPGHRLLPVQGDRWGGGHRQVVRLHEGGRCVRSVRPRQHRVASHHSE